MSDQPAHVSSALAAAIEKLKKLRRDISSVRTVAERRQTFDTPMEKRDHEQMLSRLRTWEHDLWDQIEALEKLALLAGVSADTKESKK